MSIANRVLTTMIANYIEKVMKYQGRMPTYDEITNVLAQVRRNKPIGEPVFSPRHMRPYEKSNVNDFNENIDDLIQDFKIFYEEIAFQVSRSVSYTHLTLPTN